MLYRRSARLAALLAPIALLVPVSAHAETAVFDDAAGDAKAIDFGAALSELVTDTPIDQPPLLDAPAETSADVVRTTVDHASKRLTLTFEFRDLVDIENHSLDVRIITPGGRYDLAADRSGGRTRAALFPSSSSIVIDDDGIPVGPKPCRTVRARHDLATDTLTTSVPTACLGAPRWVIVTAGVSRMKITPQADGSATIAGWADDAFRSRIGETMGRSAKVRRG